MVIRYAQKDELQLIQKIAFETWPVAYKNILSNEQLNYMLKMMYDLAVLDEQQNQLNHQFILAIDDSNKEIGFASFSKTDEIKLIYKLHKLYVLPTQQGKKVGSKLLDFVIKKIKEMEENPVLQLNVNRQNDAVKFYLNQGFSIIREEDNDIGEGYFMNDYVMQKLL